MEKGPVDEGLVTEQPPLFPLCVLGHHMQCVLAKAFGQVWTLPYQGHSWFQPA